MNHYQRGLILRLILSILGFTLAVGSYIIYPKVAQKNSNIYYNSNSNHNNNSSSWTSDYTNSNDTYNSGWDSGGDSGSWDVDGGDSRSW